MKVQDPIYRSNNIVINTPRLTRKTHAQCSSQQNRISIRQFHQTGLGSIYTKRLDGLLRAWVAY